MEWLKVMALNSSPSSQKERKKERKMLKPINHIPNDGEGRTENLLYILII
jgi:hypothetical protein